MTKKAVVLLSGGLDSTTVLAIAQSLNYQLVALSFDYGQRHRVELECARRVASAFGVADHRVVNLDLRKIGGSALTDDLAVPQGRDETAISSEIPITYVPARNTIFLSYCLALAEVTGAEDLFIGVNAIDYSGYPDCRPEFISAFETLANLATKAGVEGTSRFKIHTPLAHMTKADIVRKGMELGIDYSLTHSCYAPDDAGRACGQCDSCLLRLKGFREAGVEDPVSYQS